MDVRLPNGTVIKNVPEGTSKDVIMKKAIESGLATASDFGIQQPKEDIKPTTADIPLFDNAGNPIEPDAPRPKRELSLAEQARGAGESALALGSGITTGALGYAQGLGTGLVDAISAGEFGTQRGVERMADTASKYAAQATIAPRTEAGQRQVAAIGSVASAFPPVVGGFSPAQLAAAGQSAKATTRVLPSAAQESAQAVRQSAQNLMARPADRSVGAAEVPGELLQYQKFQELPVPVTPTMSDLAVGDSRFAWKQFENEISKDAELGAKVRDAAAQKNAQIQQNFDEFIEMTGSTLPETNYQYATGNKVVDALYKGLQSDKAKVANAYKVAEERGEMQGMIPQDRIDSISKFLNDNRAKKTSAPIIADFADEAIVQGVGEGSIADGTFRLKPMTIKQAEDLRQEIANLGNDAQRRDPYFKGQLRKMIDDAQEGLGGSAFKTARKMAKQTFDKYENYQLIDQLLSEKKGYKDARVPAEMVVQKAVMSGSVDDLKQFRSVLQRSGADGMAAWKDVQAAVLRSIRDDAVKGKSTVDNAGLIKAQAGAINKSIANLDKNGKLDLIFGKKDADKLRLLGEVSSRIAEQMTGTFNSSNNMAWVSMLKKFPLVGGAIDVIQDAASLVRDNKTRAKVRQAVNVEKTLKKQGIDVTPYKQEPRK